MGGNIHKLRVNYQLFRKIIPFLFFVVLCGIYHFYVAIVPLGWPLKTTKTQKKYKYWSDPSPCLAISRFQKCLVIGKPRYGIETPSLPYKKKCKNSTVYFRPVSHKSVSITVACRHNGRDTYQLVEEYRQCYALESILFFYSTCNQALECI